jgi:peptidoglycan/xylan/chitin deacetylase (PgdA/CDA1 family)
MIPHRTPFFLPKLYPTLHWRIPELHNTLYLTFDDGPIPEVTEEVLDILSQYNATGTFFCIGDNVEKYPGVFNQIVERGHTIGNHTFHHVSGWKTSTVDYKREIDQADIVIQEQSGIKPQLFRPPYGRITRNQIKAVSHKIIMWDVLTFDYNPSYSPEKCLQGTLKATRPGSIVVFHDSVKASKNVLYALPRFLAEYASKGYAFKALDL